MTTYSFQPQPNQPFQFTATLDGSPYIVVITWNVYRQDWYFAINDGRGNVVLMAALTGSTSTFPIDLIYGVFSTSTMTYSSVTQTIEVLP